MSDPVEDELRALLQGRASSVADARDPVAGVEAGVRRVVVRRRLVVTAGVPVLVGAVVGGAGLLSNQAQHDPSAGLAGPTPSVLAVIASAPEPSPALTSGPVGGPPPSSVPSVPPSSVATPVADPQVEIYRAYLEEDPLPRELAVAATGYGGRPYCALRVLDQSTKYADLWVFCQEYFLNGDLVADGSAGDGPVRLTITGAGSATRVVGAAAPHDGRPEQAELKALFSPLAFSRSQAYSAGILHSPGVDESVAQLKARAVADAQAGRLPTGNNVPAS